MWEWEGVRGCAWMCAGVCGCSRVCAGVRECARVCVGVRRLRRRYAWKIVEYIFTIYLSKYLLGCTWAFAQVCSACTGVHVPGKFYYSLCLINHVEQQQQQ